MAAQISSLTSRIAALETQPTSSINPIPPELKRLRSQLEEIQSTPRGISSAELMEILSERDKIWEERLRKVEETWEERLRILENRLGGLGSMRVSSNQGSVIGFTNVAGFGPIPDVIRTSTTPSPRKRPNPPSPYPFNTPNTGPSLPKKARIQPPTSAIELEIEDEEEIDHEGDTHEMEEEEDEPPPATPIPPKTPSPGHQGQRPDNSKSPLIDGSTYFTQLPNFSPSDNPDPNIPILGSSSNTGLYPMYATTPRPSDAPLISPTIDAPPSASRARLVGSGIPPLNLMSLTPSRKRSADRMTPGAIRAVSDAHHELSNITEDDRHHFSITSVRRRVASAEPHLGAGISIRDRSETPGELRGLSPSPDIPDSAGFKKPNNLPSRLSKNRREGSQSREYMKIALHGLPTPSPVDTGMEDRNERDEIGLGFLDQHSPTSGLGRSAGNMGRVDMTPEKRGGSGHRTLLGTERWRDTRFDDVPVVQWSTPRVDLGPGTPGFGS